MLSGKDVDLQGLANELNRAAKLDSLHFNKLLRNRAPYFIANIEDATTKDIILVLSAFGIRFSRTLSGSKDLNKSKITQAIFSKVAELMVSESMIENGDYTEVASILWAFSLVPNTRTEFAELWSKLDKKLEKIASEDPLQMFSSRQTTIATIRIAKSLTQLQEVGGKEGSKKNSSEKVHSSFYSAIRDLVRDKKRFTDVMELQDYVQYCNFLFFAGKI